MRIIEHPTLSPRAAGAGLVQIFNEKIRDMVRVSRLGWLLRSARAKAKKKAGIAWLEYGAA